ncbi:hypothetical protein KTAU_31420 [Thermogemmatispora aurantia]|uniref:hypothetical protein n=1 Tax=Thermogemmatispora aurantia TaxID=2045279 RepID=UPI00124D441F|nr:hypothetical protein [Thermogemmatispora aurantia]GER84506.1 hypothetical protein KTAU_31420 [Thermogemmatispora aurantia]
MSASPSPDGCRSLIALLQQYQIRLGNFATLGMAPAVREVLGDQFGEETSLEEIIQLLVAQDLARQLHDRRARRATRP